MGILVEERLMLRCTETGRKRKRDVIVYHAWLMPVCDAWKMMVRQRSRRSHYAVQHKIGDNLENRGSAVCSRYSGCRHFKLAKKNIVVSAPPTPPYLEPSVFTLVRKAQNNL